jgi:type I restriction enzyme S subunit
MNQVLPKGWFDTKLGSIIDYGKAAKKTLSDVEPDSWILELEDIEKNSSKLLRFVTASERPFKSTKNTFKKGDVLYGKLRPYLNKVIVAIEDGVCTTEIIPINSEPFCLNKYMFYWLKNSTFLHYVDEVSHGVNMPRLGTSDGKSAPFRLAPLAEQKEIVALLDKHLPQVESTKARLDAIPTILKRFRQSVLAAAVSGKLTEEWRKKQGHSFDEWKSKSLGDVAIVQTGSTPLKSENRYYDDGDIPWLTSSVTGQRVVTTADQFVTSLAVEECRLKIFKPGTLLLAMYGEGKTRGQVTEIAIRATTNQACAAILVDNNKASKNYVKLCIEASYQKTRRLAEGGNQPNLNLSKVRSIPVYLPSPIEQQEVIDVVGKLFSFADNVEVQVNTAQERVNNLSQSLLAKAFSGELTAQWRAQNPDLISGENSAAALLEKIKEERAALTAKKKPAKKTTARKAKA